MIQQNKTPYIFFLLLALMLMLQTGCGFARPYHCTSDLEQDSFNLATRNIYPDDVRITPKGYLHKSTLAWTGIIIESNYDIKEDEVIVKILIEHHHFDWLENFKLGENTFILSSRGEGRFRATWPMRLDYGLEEVKRWTAKGNMAVVYGMPVEVENGIIDFETYCVRFILPHRFRFSEYPYGRNTGWQY